MICLTFDTDWVPEIVLEFVLDILRSKKIKATIFVTGQYNCLENIDEDIIEIGLHPNFLQLENAEKTLHDIKSLYPKAISLRTHSLVHSSKFWEMYKKNNVKYTSITYMPYQSQLSPVTMPHEIIELPIFFMDDHYLEMPNITFDLEQLKLVHPGLKVLSFHPIHLYLNCSSLADYVKAKPYFDRPELLSKFRNTNRGIYQLFDSLCKHIISSDIQLCTLNEIENIY
jgi:polysaccharide deactylase WbmS-like protein